MKPSAGAKQGHLSYVYINKLIRGIFNYVTPEGGHQGCSENKIICHTYGVVIIHRTYGVVERRTAAERVLSYKLQGGGTDCAGS
jgi:hypothetical protein